MVVVRRRVELKGNLYDQLVRASLLLLLPRVRGHGGQTSVSPGSRNFQYIRMMVSDGDKDTIGGFWKYQHSITVPLAL